MSTRPERGLTPAAAGRYGRLPDVEPFIYGIKPAVLALIGGAIYRLALKAARGVELGILGMLVLAACLLGVNELLAMITAGVVGVLWFGLRERATGGRSLAVAPLLMLPSVFGSIMAWFRAFAERMPLLPRIFLVFLKIGAVLFGSGYVLVAYLEAELVDRLRLLDRSVLLDAVAVGQITPGPLLSATTFVGFHLAGVVGALLATAGVFLPAFGFVAVLGPVVPRLRTWRPAARFMDAVNVAAVAVMVAVTLALARAALVDWRAGIVAAAALAMHIALPRANTVFFVAGGAVLGYLLRLV